MQKTKIEWTDYTWNPVVGCKHGCTYCYAKKIATRFYGHFEPTFFSKRLNQPIGLAKPSKIFVCSMGELFGDWVPQEWISRVLKVIEKCPQHTFQILTKNPARAREFIFPDNVWLGTTIDTQARADNNLQMLRECSANIRFISFEPLLEEISCDMSYIDWIIIGAQTNPLKMPKKEWVERLIRQPDEYGIPVFLKDSLNWPSKRQEFP